MCKVYSPPGHGKQNALPLGARVSEQAAQVLVPVSIPAPALFSVLAPAPAPAPAPVPVPVLTPAPVLVPVLTPAPAPDLTPGSTPDPALTPLLASHLVLPFPPNLAPPRILHRPRPRPVIILLNILPCPLS